MHLAEDAPLLGIQAQSQHIDLENVYVGVDEGSDSYGTSFFVNFSFFNFQEHQLLGTSEFWSTSPRSLFLYKQSEILNVNMIECTSL